MKLYYTLLLFCSTLLIGVINIPAQTNIPGGIVNGNWTISGSPYLIQGAIMIPNGSTLTIEPGVTVNFQGQYKFLVLGQLLARGTTLDSIIFTATNTNTGWQGIRFENTSTSNDSSIISFCRLEYGNANGASSLSHGGALFFDSFSKALISNSTIINCHANFYGGGIYCNNSSSPRIINNSITNNTCIKGGGIYCYNSSNPYIFNNNISYNNASTNSNDGAGGAIYCYNSSSPIILSNIISYNNVGNGRGGGIFNIQSSTIISNNIISYNNANNGGGIYSGSGNSEVISNNYIANNTAYYGGGGIHSMGGNISNNVIVNNECVQNGGGIFCTYGNPIIENNTISNNIAAKGNSIFCNQSSNPTILNSILWNEIPAQQIYLDDEGSDPNIFYCNIQGGQTGIEVNSNVFYLGTYSNNININPDFINPSNGSGVGFDGLNSDWSIDGSSPCVNSGNPTGVYPLTDIIGNPRISNGIIDIGAYESFSVGLIEKPIDSDLSLFPNPNNGVFTFSYNLNKAAELSIYNNIGQQVKTISLPTHTQTITVNMTPFAKGIYIYKVTEKDKLIAVSKFIIQ